MSPQGSALQSYGAGPPVVWLHGLLGSAAVWRYNTGPMSRYFTIWTGDLPAMGAAEPLLHYDMSLPRLSEWLQEALTPLRGERFSLIGSSWGGAVALWFAAHAPLANRLERMVLAAPVHPDFHPSPRQRLLLRPFWARLGANLLRHAPMRQKGEILAAMFGDRARIPPDSLAIYQRGLARPDLGRAMAGYVRHWRRDLAALRPALARIQCPVLLVWGGRDRAVPITGAAALQRALPVASLTRWPELGHLPYEEDSGRFNQTVLGFLTSCAL